MELRQLQYFVAVVEEESFTRAAARVHVAQPGVSAQIRRLEREFGHDLLDRSGRAVRLTEVGAAVLPYARAALAAVDGARTAVDELTGLVRGRVAIGTVASHEVDLPGMLAGFHRDHPGVEITLFEANSDLLVEALRTGRADLALVGLPGEAPDGLDAHVLVDEELVLACSPDHELASRSTCSLDGLRDQVLISLPRGTGLRTALDTACAARGFQPHIAFEASRPATLAHLAARGLGLAVLPAPAARYYASELHAIAMRPRLRSRIVLAWRSEGTISPAARTLVAHARRTLGG